MVKIQHGMPYSAHEVKKFSISLMLIRINKRFSMKKRILLWIAMIFAGCFSHAGQVPVHIAQKAAAGFFTAHYPGPGLKAGATASITETIVYSREGFILYYIFNMLPGGWIAISADDGAWPVIGYSFEGSYTGKNFPPQFTAWMKQYQLALLDLAKHPAKPSREAAEAWNSLLDDNYPARHLQKPLSSVAPLISSNWDQGMYYDGMCPADPAGPGGHTWAGCVPTAMGQIMYYYRWPRTGTGSYSYTDAKYGLQSADFGATTYNWENMPDALTRQNDAVAQLLYHLGVSCDLVYGASGSGMYNHKAAYSFRTYFKYSPQTQYLFRDSTSLRWDSILVAHLNRSMPLYYAGWSVPNIDGHAFVCDGYQDTTYFHFNWGWSASYNGYYYTNNLTPGGNNFRLAQEIIMNCFPDTINYTYPVGCQGSLTLNFFDGSLSDGSGPVKTYSPAADCSWLIDPQTSQDSVSGINISFDYFDTNPSDFVKIYNGPTETSPLLGSYSGSSLPPSLNSTSNKVLVRFKANGGIAGKGFQANFSSALPVWCSGTQVIQADTADFTNGSFGFDYANNTNCRWRIERNDTLPLTIYFKRFDTEAGKDALTIYDLGNGLPLDTISGRYDSTGMPAPVTSPSGKMFLIFTTNSTVTGKGWEIYYPKRNTGINETRANSPLNLFPNPAREFVTIRITSNQPESGEIILASPDGRQMIRLPVNAVQGENEFRLNLEGLSAGLYFVSLKGNISSAASKLIITK